MSSFNMENQTNYISQLSEDEKIIFLQALTRLARCDKNFEDEEKSFIKDLAIVFGISKDKSDIVLQKLSDDELLQKVACIKNRQAALQLIKECCLLANSDGELSEREVLLIGKMGQAMGVELEKVEQISQWVVDRIIWLEEGKIIFEQV